MEKCAPVIYLEVDALFAEVDAALLRPAAWNLIQARLYLFQEAIHVKEARAVVFWP